MKTKLLSLSCAVALGCFYATPAWASNGTDYYADATSIAVDAVVVRPLCLVATVIGSALFVVSLPFAAPSKSVHRAAHALVVQPARTTFTRPLGDLDDLTDY